jgi:hypothetical protein
VAELRRQAKGQADAAPLKEGGRGPDNLLVSTCERVAAPGLRNLVRAAPLAIVIATADWILKAVAVASGQEFRFHWFHERPYAWLFVVAAILYVGLMTVTARTRLAMVGLGVVLGAAIGNLGELAAFGHVTDVIPFPPGFLSAPADFFALGGAALFWTEWARDRARRRRVAASS